MKGYGGEPEKDRGKRNKDGWGQDRRRMRAGTGDKDKGDDNNKDTQGHGQEARAWATMDRGAKRRHKLRAGMRAARARTISTPRG